MEIKLDLQRFAEGGAAGGGGNGGGAPMATGQSGQENGQTMQPEQQMQQSQGMQQRPGFRDLIKDPQYKQDADAWLKETMDKRFRGQDQMRQQLQQLQESSQKMQPILGLIGQKYGKDAADLDGIRQAMEADDSIYAAKAAEAGMPVKAYKKLDMLEKENQQYKAQRQQAEKEAAFRKHYEGLHQQAQQLQQQFPNFNLQAELQNEKFLHWTSPQVGMSVKDAYFALHADEIQKQGMQYAGQQSAQAVMASVRSGAMRPQENATGMSPTGGMRVDVSKMTEEQLDEIDRQSRIRRTTLW